MNPDRLKLSEFVGLKMERKRDPNDEIAPKGHFKVEHFDKDGNLIGVYEMDNLVTNVGKNHWLGVEFNAQTQITTWYMGLVDNSGWTAELATDTLASHSGWNENNSYSGNRKTWTTGAASGQSISNPSPTSFTMTGSATLHGIFICSAASGTSGTLWNTADFASTVPVNNGDVLNVTYTINS